MFLRSGYQGCYHESSLSLVSSSCLEVQTISSPTWGAGHSCQLHHWSSGMLLVVEPSAHP